MILQDKNISTDKICLKVEEKTGLPWWLSSRESTCSARELGPIPRSGSFPGGVHVNPPVVLPGGSHGQTSLACPGSQSLYSPQCHKELDTTEAIEHARLYLTSEGQGVSMIKLAKIVHDNHINILDLDAEMRNGIQ